MSPHAAWMRVFDIIGISRQSSDHSHRLADEVGVHGVQSSRMDMYSMQLVEIQAYEVLHNGVPPPSEGYRDGCGLE